jgi:hypothetical protein
MIEAVRSGPTASEGRIVRECGETESAARLLRDGDMAVRDRHVLRRKDKASGCHPVLL